MALKRTRELDGGWSKEYEGVEALAMNDCNRLLSRIDKPAQRKFKCKTCDRCFDSFQALGGHTTGHRSKAGDPLKNQKIHTCSKTCSKCGAQESKDSHVFKDVFEVRHQNTSPSPTHSEEAELTAKEKVALWKVSGLRKNNSCKAQKRIFSTCQVSHGYSPVQGNGGAEYSSGQDLGRHVRQHQNTSPNPTYSKESEGARISKLTARDNVAFWNVSDSTKTSISNRVRKTIWSTPPRVYSPVQGFDLNLSPRDEEINFADENNPPEEENYSKLRFGDSKFKSLERDVNLKFYHFL